MSLQTRFDQLEKDIAKQRELNKDWILQNEWPTEDDYLYDTVPITFDSFQQGASWSAERNPKDLPEDVYHSLGLAEEAGEVIGNIKKTFRDNGGQLTEKRRDNILEESGDLLFYLSNLLNSVNIKLSDVAKFNQKKMLIRLKKYREKVNNSSNTRDANNGGS